VLLEEGFSDEGDPDTFDEDFVRETLVTLPRLAALDEAAIDALLEGFAEAQPRPERPAALKAADALLSEAWGDGLQPLTSEHAELAVEAMWSEGAEEDAPKLVAMLTACLTHLEKLGLIGPARRQRLADTAQATLNTLQRGDEEDEDEVDDDGDDEPESEGGGPLN
jgi:hypothetical protein